MKSLKKILLSLVIAASAGAFSSSALAESDPGKSQRGIQLHET